MPVRVNPRIDSAVKEAARRRNLSVAAYARRAAAAFAEHDTGIPWDELMFDEPGFGLFGETPGAGAIRPDGHGFGPWKIVAVEKHHPDD